MKIEKIGQDRKCAVCGCTPTIKIVFEDGDKQEIYLCRNGLEKIGQNISDYLNQ